MSETITGGEAIIRSVMANAVDTVFGLPGAQIYPLFDAMQRLGVRTVTSRHEQGAAYMALGYARASGRPGVFAVVPGPGVLNSGAALCTAMGTCSPVLCLSGQVPSGFLGSGRGHLHELPDQVATLSSFIKRAVHIDQPDNTQAIINDAFHCMLSDRPGPVAVEMCWDTMALPCSAVTGTGLAHVDQPDADPEMLDAAADMLAGARSVMIMCGAGAQHASTEVLQLAELLDAPVTAFRSGRGVVAEDHELGVSAVAARLLWQDTDVLLGIGSRLEMPYMRWADMGRYDRHPAPGSPKVIRIDIDADEMQRFRPDIGIVADSAAASRLLAERLASRLTARRSDRSRITRAKHKARQMIEKVQPQLAYLDVIREVLPRDGFLVPELSQVGFTTYFGFPVLAPRTYVTEGYQGTLGFGFPTALGVKVAFPRRAVLSVTGDGGFLFGMPELATARAHGIGLVTLLFNNQAYANVRRDQLTQYDGRINGADLVNPDFMKLAESFDVAGYRVGSPAQLRPVLEQAFADDRPALIEVPIEEDAETSPWEFIHMPPDSDKWKVN